MTKNIVLLGGSGYIGRELVKAWRSRVADTEFWVLSRSGATRLDLPGVHGVAVDLLRPQMADDALPDQVDYIVDLVGGPKDDPQELADFNRLPAQFMQRLADQYHPTAMGFIGGKLGPKTFVAIKRDLIQELQSSPTPLAVVEPTLVYGAGRKDQMTRFVPLLRVLGAVVPSLRPVKVDTVVMTLLNELLAK